MIMLLFWVWSAMTVITDPIPYTCICFLTSFSCWLIVGHNSVHPSPLPNDPSCSVCLLCIHGTCGNTSQCNCFFLWLHQSLQYGKTKCTCVHCPVLLLKKKMKCYFDDSIFNHMLSPGVKYTRYCKCCNEIHKVMNAQASPIRICTKFFFFLPITFETDHHGVWWWEWSAAFCWCSLWWSSKVTNFSTSLGRSQATNFVITNIEW